MSIQDLMQQPLSGEQDIVKQTRELLALQEKLRMERQAQMQRLAAAQRSLQELAREIERRAEKEKGLLGRMDRIEEEMEEVLRDLEGGNVDERTLEHEERILSRLLDAQRSIHSRDYERKRESKTAADIESRGGKRKAEKTEAMKLREQIRKAMKLRGPAEFEELIRLYFRAIAQGEGE